MDRVDSSFFSETENTDLNPCDDLTRFHPSSKKCNILVIGPRGSGSSSFINTLFSNKMFVPKVAKVRASGKRDFVVTESFQAYDIGENVTLYDIWGLQLVWNEKLNLTKEEFVHVLKGGLKVGEKKVNESGEKNPKKSIDAVILVFDSSVKSNNKIVKKTKDLVEAAKDLKIPVLSVICKVDYLVNSANDKYEVLTDHRIDRALKRCYYSRTILDLSRKVSECLGQRDTVPIFPMINYDPVSVLASDLILEMKKVFVRNLISVLEEKTV